MSGKPTHGHCSADKKSPEYGSWHSMKRRCTSPKDKAFSNYGGRGITFCDRWGTFTNFLEDMGLKPTPGHTLDRIDNSLGYYKENCQWASRAHQNRNRRDNLFLTVGDITQTITDWVKVSPVTQAAIKHRINKHGWSHEDAILTPPYKKMGSR